MEDEVLVRVHASPLRRWMGVSMLMLIGALVIYLAFARPPEPAWQAVLIVVGVLALWMGERMRRATANCIELTETELRDSGGGQIARVDEIAAIERGAFAFKPSHGFLVRTRVSAGGVWRPGLWWRFGRRVGVGGVTPGAQTKAMAEILSVMLARRGQENAPPAD